MLRVDGQLQRIRNLYETRGNFGDLNDYVFEIPHPDPYNSRTMRVTVSFTRSTGWDTAIGTDIGYHKIVATAEWNENMPRMGRGLNNRQDTRFITLREDYFFQRM
jgi:hypothetical protein